MRERIPLLLIEDDKPLADLIADFLSNHHYQVDTVYSGRQLAQLPEEAFYALIICDLNLPDTHGFELFDILQHRFQAPTIFLTANSDDETQIKGLDLGATDYIIKPVEPKVLLARIKACLRITKPEIGDRLAVGSLVLDRNTYSTRMAERPIHLTNYEFELLWVFMKNQGSVLDRDFLFEQTIGREYNGEDRTLDGRISRLRKKLDDLNIPSLTIKTIWGKGYLFDYQQLDNA